MKKKLNIVVPMAGAGSRFAQAGYTFPKPLIAVNGKPMIQLVIENLKPTCDHRFIFICQEEHYDTYSLSQIFSNLTNNKYEVIKINALTQGAVCTVLTATDLINTDDDLLIANSDQLVDINIDDYINHARKAKVDGSIMTFSSSHPKWSYARIDANGDVMETVEKKVVSEHATVGIYYYRKGKEFVEASIKMIDKNIRINNEFYVCPMYNEMILDDKRVVIYPIEVSQMHGLGTPEDLNIYLTKVKPS